MRSPNRLTDITIRNLKPSHARREIPDPGARGLYVVVHPSGRKSFAVRYRHAGLPRKLTLQSGISLAAARKLAADALHELAQGRDPAAAKKAQKAKTATAAGNTLQRIAEDYLKREGGKLRTVVLREQTLRRLVFPTLGDRPVDSIKRSDIVRLLDKIEDTCGSRQADIVLAYVRKVLNWHAARDDDFRSPIVRGMGRYDTAANARHRVLSDDEIRTLWKATAAEHPFNACIRFLLLTGCRRSEAAGLRWDEINGADWLLPAARHKNKTTDLLRPLSKAALTLVEAQPRISDSPWVFSHTGKRPVRFGRATRAFMVNSGIQGWRLHDLRRTARTLLSRAGVNADICERCLGHALPGIRGTYDRHQYRHEMAHAFEALAALLDRIVNPPADSVVPMRRPAAVD